ncbi:hypothetical protein NW754_002632 [Fusarium falciforme]|nr:hypothetical protein NW754_002632 [Fusarium falciforme]
MLKFTTLLKSFDLVTNEAVMRFSLILCLAAAMLGRAAAQTDLVTLPNCTVQCFQTSISNTSWDQSATIIGILASFGSFAILLVLIRVFGRLWITKVDLDWDNYLIVLAVISASVINFICYPMAHLGMGEDFGTIPFPDIDMTLKLLYVAEIFYMFAEMLV